MNLTKNIHEYFLLNLPKSFIDQLMVCCYLMVWYYLNYHFLRYVQSKFIFWVDLLLMYNFSNLILFFYLRCRLLWKFGNSLKLLIFLTNVFLLIFKLQIIVSEVFEILIFLFEIWLQILQTSLFEIQIILFIIQNFFLNWKYLLI